MLCADMVNVTWKDPLGKHQRTMGLLEDISHSGACLQLDMPVPEGSEIRWSSPKREFTGRVRYCTYREIGYFVGVELAANSKWSRRVYQPRHFLDVRGLLNHPK